jgi:hypothetical protein
MPAGYAEGIHARTAGAPGRAAPARPAAAMPARSWSQP